MGKSNFSKVPKKQAKFYVDKAEFLQELIDYRAIWSNLAEGEPMPVIPTCIAKKILLIAQRMSFMPNFIGYTYRDEMVSDAIENCIRYCRNFDPAKSQNPFGYFSQITSYAFIRRLQREKKAFYTKVAYVQQSSACVDEFSTGSQDSSADYNNGYRDFLRDFYDVEMDAKFAKKKKTPRVRKVNAPEITEFIEVTST
ncbi:MAG: hypothetical protein R8M45_05460 [Ghiorsea sp.]